MISSTAACTYNIKLFINMMNIENHNSVMNQNKTCLCELFYYY